MGEKQPHHGDTDEFLAVRFPNLNKSWLDQINDMVGLLKQRFSGNARMFVPWSGGIPQETEWTICNKPARPVKKQ